MWRLGVLIGFFLPARLELGATRRRALNQLGDPEVVGLFVASDGSVLDVLDEDSFALLFGRARTAHILKGDAERQIDRSRAARQLAMWSPRRRRVQRLAVVGVDGEVLRDAGAAAVELARHWGLVFSVLLSTCLHSARGRRLRDPLVRTCAGFRRRSSWM